MRNTMVFVTATVCLALSACAPGFIKVKDLNTLEQGPSHCADRCAELEMQMGAFVMVSNQVPGCVCVPRDTENAPVSQSAAAASMGHIVIMAAAAAARQKQQEQQQRRQRPRQLHESSSF